MLRSTPLLPENRNHDNTDLFVKPTTPSGWFMGPDQVPFVWGPFIPKTEGLLLSLVQKGFGYDVHVLNSMARVMDDTTTTMLLYNTTMVAPPAYASLELSAEARKNFLSSQAAKLHQSLSATRPLGLQVYEELLTLHRFLSLDIGQVDVPKELTSVLCALGDDALGTTFPEEAAFLPLFAFPTAEGRHDDAQEPLPPPAIGEAPPAQPLPLEYLTTMTRVILELGHEETDASYVMFDRVAQRCLVDLQQTKRVTVEVTSRLGLLCAWAWERMKTNRLLSLDEGQAKLVISLLGHPQDDVVTTATNLLLATAWYGNHTHHDSRFIEHLTRILTSSFRSARAKTVALLALPNIPGPRYADAMLNGELDAVVVNLMSPKEPAECRDVAGLNVHYLIRDGNLKPELLVQVTRNVAANMCMDSDPSEFCLYPLLGEVCGMLEDLLQRSDDRELFVSCVKILRERENFAAYKRYEAYEVTPDSDLAQFYDQYVNIQSKYWRPDQVAERIGASQDRAATTDHIRQLKTSTSNP